MHLGYRQGDIADVDDQDPRRAGPREMLHRLHDVATQNGAGRLLAKRGLQHFFAVRIVDESKRSRSPGRRLAGGLGGGWRVEEVHQCAVGMTAKVSFNAGRSLTLSA